MAESQSATDVLEALASLPSFHHPTVSHDGESVAVYYDESGRNELHVVDVATGERRQVSSGEVPRNARWPVSWGADDDRVYFHLDDAGDEQNDVYAVRVDETDDGDAEVGHVEPVIEGDGQIALQAVGDDGETLIYGSTADGQMNLYRYDLPTDTAEKVTHHERAAGGATLAPGADRLAYTTNESDDYDNQDVFLVDVDGSNRRNLRIGETGAEASPVDWGPDGDRLLVSDNTENFSRAGIYHVTDDAETRDAEHVEWFGDGDAEEHPVGFLPDGERFIARRTEDAAVEAVVYDVESGEREALELPVGVTTPCSRAVDDDTLVVSHTTPSERPSLLAYDLTTGETRTLVAADYGSFDPDRFADAEYFRFESHDGLEIGALLYDSGERPSPLVVNPHGGPRAMDTRSFGLYAQVLVELGFSVLQVNYRGSTGRGREFVERLYDDWGGGEQDDVAAAVRHALDTRDWLDDDRVVVFGGSYGGYSAYWQMVRYPELYAAGVAWIGVTDLEDMYENTMPHFRTELMEKYLGSPAENPERYRERSPVTHAANLAAPLLMVHGVNDRRVPVSQARIFRDALVDAGFEEGENADYEYVELGEEGHASSDQDQKARMFRTLADFLARRVPSA